MQQLTFTCGKCSTVRPLPFGYSPKDGDVLKCNWCSTRYVTHLCNHSHNYDQLTLPSAIQVELLEVLVAGVTKACAPCGVWYKVGQIVERFDPQLGKAIKETAIGVGIAILVYHGFQYLNARR